ncbi:hypothetical protein PAXRUDRAFT_831970 [Paxillus rubicundulus Ve08.2h10]|uniref:Uncharacterized protein n=1 Tax=Paxillus rubicundulus Ve08.2h10 TaxID=930991 RepID=A0A0D0DIJ4_9AGAM|nr:hypothetical protein PAXRUDRAFT_831970 [Paxillus rubicundulus Ve08.2h10]
MTYAWIVISQVVIHPSHASLPYGVEILDILATSVAERWRHQVRVVLVDLTPPLQFLPTLGSVACAVQLCLQRACDSQGYYSFERRIQ